MKYLNLLLAIAALVTATVYAVTNQYDKATFCLVYAVLLRNDYLHAKED